MLEHSLQKPQPIYCNGVMPVCHQLHSQDVPCIHICSNHSKQPRFPVLLSALQTSPAQYPVIRNSYISIYICCQFRRRAIQEQLVVSNRSKSSDAMKVVSVSPSLIDKVELEEGGHILIYRFIKLLYFFYPLFQSLRELFFSLNFSTNKFFFNYHVSVHLRNIYCLTISSHSFKMFYIFIN